MSDLSATDLIVPVGLGAIGALIVFKMYQGCGCHPRRAGLAHTLYPQVWRNRIGHFEAIHFDHYKDSGASRPISQYVKMAADGHIAVPADGLAKQPTLHPGMLNPANGQRYELQQVHQLVRQIATHPVPAKRTGFKRKTVRVEDLL